MSRRAFKERLRLRQRPRRRSVSKQRSDSGRPTSLHNFHDMKKNAHTTGFTLIESIVAISVLTLAVAGPLTLAAHSLKASRDARAEFIATHLAEEALEVVHNIRTNNSANDNTADRSEWMRGI